MNEPYRQGDVFLLPIESIPESTEVPRDRGRVILAYGEATGHAHAIEAPEATLLTDAENARFLRIVGSGATVTHEEHGSITLPPGSYRVVISREWADDMAARPVID
jgi:hypothetical protein